MNHFFVNDSIYNENRQVSHKYPEIIGNFYFFAVEYQAIDWYSSI